MKNRILLFLIRWYDLIDQFTPPMVAASLRREFGIVVGIGGREIADLGIERGLGGKAYQTESISREPDNEGAGRGRAGSRIE